MRLVCVILLFEWAQTILTTEQCFTEFVLLAPEAGFFSFLVDTWVMAYLMPAFTAATVQVFLVWRITVISQRRLFAAIILPVRSQP